MVVTLNLMRYTLSLVLATLLVGCQACGSTSEHPDAATLFPPPLPAVDCSQAHCECAQSVELRAGEPACFATIEGCYEAACLQPRPDAGDGD